jgi:hypothetical protein
MKFRIWFIAAVLVASLILGLITGPWQRELWRTAREVHPEINVADLEDNLGQGLVLGLIGGFRAVLADFVWIRANMSWEREDLSQTESFIRLTTMIDPRPVFFWINGARIFAYDMPVWRIRAMGVPWGTFPQREERLRSEQALMGLDFIDQALRYHPGNYRLILDSAMIHSMRLNDPNTAAETLAPYVWDEGIPFFIPRLYARFLEDAGRVAEALGFLESLLPTLPEDVIQAQVPIVRERIGDLRARLEAERNTSG